MSRDLVRTVTIRARRDTVFRYFTDSQRFAAWWGEGSRIDAREGGEVLIRYPGGSSASGVVREIVPGERVVFTFGYDTPGKPIPPGGSTVVVTFADQPDGTLVTLRHADLPEAVAREHVQGWRYQLALFSKVAAAEQHARVVEVVDRWFAAWAEADPARRMALLAACAASGVTFRDDYGALVGHEDVDAHIAASQVHFRGTRMVRRGEVQQCQGTALVRWEAQSADGRPVASGTNVFELAPDGRIAGAVGFWD